MRASIAKAAALVLGGALALTGCGSPTTASTADAGASTTGTLRVLVPSYPASNDGKAALQKVVDSFHKTYPNVTVEPDFATFATLNEKITTSIASGTPYDVIVTGVGWIPPFASNDQFVDLTTVGVTPETLAKDTVPSMISAGVYNGKVYGVPLIAAPKTLALRKSMFVAAGLDPSKPPTTLADIEKDAKLLTKTEGGKITVAGFDFWAAAGAYRQDFVSILGSLGVPLYKDGKPAFNGPEGVQALTWISDMINKDKVIGYAQVSSDGSSLVTTGGAAMGFTGGYVDCAKVTQAVCDDLVYFNLNDKSEAMFAGGQLASIGAGSKLTGAAWAFIQQMRTPDALADISKLNFAVPATLGAETTTAVTSNPASKFVYSKLDKSVFEGGATNWLDLRNTFGPTLDQAILGKVTPAAALATLASQSK